jgi:low temperature requirement protein LtrA
VTAPSPASPDAERRWLELFYDLVFVAAILVLSSAFSHTHDVAAVAVIVALAEWADWFDAYLSVACFAVVAVVHAALEAQARKATTVLKTS